jgi:peptide/nickel transport system permease protein
MISLVLLLSYSLVAVLDSIHFKFSQTGSSKEISYQVQSLFDVLIRPLGLNKEYSYSAPFSIFSSSKSVSIYKGKAITYYPKLTYAGWQLKKPSDKTKDIIKRVSASVLVGLLLSGLLALVFFYCFAKKIKHSLPKTIVKILSGKTEIAWREMLITFCAIIIFVCFIKFVSPYYHILGTDKIGVDELYETLKSIRTGLVIGTLTTLVMLPFAVFFGMLAGYFGGWRDDIIQYVYTTLSSVPGVLLITASVLSLQLFISNHTRLFPTLESRADARLLALCLILGITSWTSLCRLLRAETLKLREIDFVKASIALGVSSYKTIWRHIFPNVLHIILITVVIDFSALVLAEAVLSYVGVGVDPITPSWGNMINSARLDLARDPVVWWPLFSAFIFMFVLVLAANLFADATRDAFDPRLQDES